MVKETNPKWSAGIMQSKLSAVRAAFDTAERLFVEANRSRKVDMRDEAYDVMDWVNELGNTHQTANMKNDYRKLRTYVKKWLEGLNDDPEMQTHVNEFIASYPGKHGIDYDVEVVKTFTTSYRVTFTKGNVELVVAIV